MWYTSGATSRRLTTRMTADLEIFHPELTFPFTGSLPSCISTHNKGDHMLWNRDWDKPQPKPGTWASVIAWLETMDPNESYVYVSHTNCLAGQYNRAAN